MLTNLKKTNNTELDDIYNEFINSENEHILEMVKRQNKIIKLITKEKPLEGHTFLHSNART